MTREEIESMMSDAGLKPPARGAFIFIHWDQIDMLLKHQRELCAKACDDMDNESAWKRNNTNCAAAIRRMK